MSVILEIRKAKQQVLCAQEHLDMAYGDLRKAKRILGQSALKDNKYKESLLGKVEAFSVVLHEAIVRTPKV